MTGICSYDIHHYYKMDGCSEKVYNSEAICIAAMKLCLRRSVQEFEFLSSCCRHCEERRDAFVLSRNDAISQLKTSFYNEIALSQKIHLSIKIFRLLAMTFYTMLNRITERKRVRRNER